MPALDALNDANGELFVPHDEARKREMANARAIVFRVSGTCGRAQMLQSVCVLRLCMYVDP